MYILAAFIAVPLIEIALFIQVGGWIGLWPTLAVVVVTAIAGTAMVRSQGFRVLRQLQTSLDEMHDPTEPLVHGAMILFSGALLLTPGFFTDAVGFALLVPGVRVALFGAIRKRVNVQSFARGRPRPDRPARDQVIDADYAEVNPDDVPPRRTDTPSNWTRR